MAEFTHTGTLRSGDRNKQVRRVQEWLSLRGFGVVPDGDFGPATQFAVKQFQKERGLNVSGVVTKDTFETLVSPMLDSQAEIAVRPTLGETVTAYALRHLAAGPREIGGQNCGPWVRLYMGGNEGPAFPWCAGFACHVLKQACRAHAVPMPIQASVSCDFLALSAKSKGRFLAERGLDRREVKPGMLFLNRRTSTDWTHVGIVVAAESQVFLTVEGNTNDEGSREGYEVCRRIRSYKKKDFIRVD